MIVVVHDSGLLSHQSDVPCELGCMFKSVHNVEVFMINHFNHFNKAMLEINHLLIEVLKIYHFHQNL